MSAFATIALLVGSNLFMTFAWYGHLKEADRYPWYAAILLSWGRGIFLNIVCKYQPIASALAL